MEKLKKEGDPDVKPHYEIVRSLEKKEIIKTKVLAILGEYPNNFFTGFFEELVASDFEVSDIAVAKIGQETVGCIFHKSETHEFDWLAIKREINVDKKQIAKNLFQTVFDTIPPGTPYFWYVNTEDAVFKGKPVGQYFEPARRLYRDMGLTFTKMPNKFGDGNHAYKIEGITK